MHKGRTPPISVINWLTTKDVGEINSKTDSKALFCALVNKSMQKLPSWWMWRRQACSKDWIRNLQSAIKALYG